MILNAIDLLGFSLSLLSFVFVFAILQRINLFTKKINIIISLVTSFFVLFVFFEYRTTIIVLFSLLAIFFVVVIVFLIFVQKVRKVMEF